MSNENIVALNTKNSSIALNEKNKPVFEHELHANFFLVRRFDIVVRKKSFRCAPSIQLCVLSDIDINWAPMLRQILPEKFYFSQFVYYNELTGAKERLLDVFCLENTSDVEDEYLGVEPSCDEFDRMAADVLKRWGVERQGTLIVAPLRWVTTVIRRMREIEALMGGFR